MPKVNDLLELFVKFDPLDLLPHLITQHNTSLDISKIKKEKVKNSLKEEPHVRYRTDEELDHIMNDFGGEDIMDDEHIVID